MLSPSMITAPNTNIQPAEELDKRLRRELGEDSVHQWLQDLGGSEARLHKGVARVLGLQGIQQKWACAFALYSLDCCVKGTLFPL